MSKSFTFEPKDANKEWMHFALGCDRGEFFGGRAEAQVVVEAIGRQVERQINWAGNSKSKLHDLIREHAKHTELVAQFRCASIFKRIWYALTGDIR